MADSVETERTGVWRSSTLYIAFVASWGVFIDNLCFGAALPVYAFALEERLNLPDSDTQQYISGLIATEGVAILIASPILGYVLDHVQRLRFFLLIGFGIQVLSLVLHLIGTNVGLLFAGRFLQGISSSFIWICGSAMVVKSSAVKDTGRFLGFLTFAQSGGTFLGPILGGAVYDRVGYRAVFVCLLAIMSIDFVLRAFMIERDARRPGRCESSLSETTPILQVDGQTSGDGSGSERKANGWGKPLFRSLLQSSRISTGLFGAFALVSLDTALDTILVPFVKNTFEWNSLASGLIFLCLFVPDLFSPLIGYMSDRLGVVYLAVPAFLSMTPLFVALRFVDTTALADKSLFAALLTLIGFGLTFAETPLLAELDHAIEDDLEPNEGRTEAHTYALYMMAYGFGQIVGPIVAGFLNAYTSWGTTVAVLGAWSGFTAIPVLIWMRREPETQ